MPAASPFGSWLRGLARRLPYLRDVHGYIRALEAERDRLQTEVAHWKTWMSPGHFYSPIPSLPELARRDAQVFGPPPQELGGIHLRVEQQLALLETLTRYYAELPFPRHRSESTRYWLDNDAFAFSDAIYLYLMLRHLRPQRVIEVGSGFSSAVMLDTAERFLGGAVNLTFIEPDLSTLRALWREGDARVISTIELPLQDVPLSRFDSLQSGDILFIDSSHVVKTGSDVNQLFFEVLPRLQRGVYVHIHDIQYPFEYPKPWVYEGRAWNEAYLVRAFLQFNADFEIVLFPSYLGLFHRDLLQRTMPLVTENSPGSLWLRRRE
jgi:predicted O-methyltransferase YrrM